MIRTVFGLWLALATAASAQSDAPRQTPPPFGDWQVVCDEAGCRLSQSIVASENGVSLLLVRVFGGSAATTILTAPLGVFLKTGLVIKVDGNRARAYGFEICDNLGCHAGIALDDDLVREFERGLVAEVTYFDGSQNRVSLPVSLTGFTAGYAALNDGAQ